MDFFLILLFLLLSLGLTFLTARGAPGKRAVIWVEGKRVAVLPLDQPTRLSVTGNRGTTIIEVDHKGVHIIDSPCPNKTCIRMGYARRNGQMLICAPNHVAVRIESDESDDVDAVTG